MMIGGEEVEKKSGIPASWRGWNELILGLTYSSCAFLEAMQSQLWEFGDLFTLLSYGSFFQSLVLYRAAMDRCKRELCHEHEPAESTSEASSSPRSSILSKLHVS